MACRKNSPGIPCCCTIAIADLPDIRIFGMTPDAWVSVSSCCFSRRYNYDAAQPRKAWSVEVQKVEQVITATEIQKIAIRTDYVTQCPPAFDCAQGERRAVYTEYERLGLIYQMQSIDVWIQLTQVDCVSGVAPRYIVSTKHNFGWRSGFTSGSSSSTSGTFTSKNCCTGAALYNFSTFLDQPDWTSPASYTNGVAGALVTDSTWNHEVYDALPTDMAVVIQGCVSPCTLPDQCTPICDDFCLTMEPSRTVTSLSSLCANGPYLSSTCIVNYVTPICPPFVGCPCWTKTRWSLTLPNANPCELTGMFLDSIFVNALPCKRPSDDIAKSFVDTTAYTNTTTCTYTAGATVCVTDYATLIFGTPPNTFLSDFGFESSDMIRDLVT